MREIFLAEAAHQSHWRVLRVGFVSALAVISTTVGVVAAHSADSPGPGPLEISFISGHRDVSISWDVRAMAAVRLRLYRAVPNGAEILIGEFPAERGVSSFRTVDGFSISGSKIYRLKLAEIDGSETTLGSILCIELGFETGVEATVAGTNPGVAIPEIVQLSDGGSGSVSTVDCGCRSEGAPAPDPPVPRSC